MCQDGLRKAQAQLELNFATDAKNNRMSCYRYAGQKRKIKESAPSPFLNQTGELVTTNVEKAKWINNFCLPQFSIVLYLPTSLSP